MNFDICCTAAKRSQLKVIGRYWQLSLLLLVLATWTTVAAPQQRDPQMRPESSAVSSDQASDRSGAVSSDQDSALSSDQDSAVPSEQDGAISSAQDEDRSGDDSAVVKENLAERIISILRENSEDMANAKDEIARQTSTDPGTISDEAAFRRIRQSSELQARIAQELSARGYDLSEGGSGPSVRERVGNDDRDSRAQRSDHLSERSRAGFSAERRDHKKLQSRREKTEEEPVDELQLRQRRSPYPGLESLKDLYSQFPASHGKLKRFGSDTFRRGTGNADELPMDVPVGPDYVLGPGDALVLNLWGSTSQRLNRTIDRQGQIALPEAGPIAVAGSTIEQAQQSIQKALGEQFKDIHVEISLGRLRTVRVYVVGDVQRPGAYDISALSTPLNALYAAGGPSSRGSLRTLRQYRGDKLVREIDLYEFLLRGVRSDVDRLLPGDTILVPPVGPQVSIAGMVRRPAIYELRGEQNLKEVLDLAGGVLVSATLRQIAVERIEAHERRTMLSVQIPQGESKESASKALAGFLMQDGDQVLVSPILPYNERAVFLEGHLFRPGKYPYRDGMTLNDLLRSYQDVMPEPADHAEVIRLQPPDFRPETISFSLSELLSGDDPISLQPFDVIRVFSRYEIDPPKVFIYGEVLRPGQYPMAGGMTVAGLVNLAGGFKRSAYRETADLSSYIVQDATKSTYRTKSCATCRLPWRESRTLMWCSSRAMC